MKQILYIIILIVCLSCTKKGNRSHIPETLTIEKSDSIRIDFLGDLNFMDINTSYNRVLFYSYQKREFLTTDLDGNILTSFVLDEGLGLGNYPIACAHLIEKGFSFISNKGIFNISLDGLIESQNKFNRQTSTSFVARFGTDNTFIEKNGAYYFSAVSTDFDFPRNKKEFYDNFKFLGKFNKDDQELILDMGFDKNSIFQNGNAHELSDITPIFRNVKDQLFVINSKEPLINCYHIDNFKIPKKQISLSIPDYQLNTGEDMNSVNPTSISFDTSWGSIINFFVLDEDFLVFYKKGYEQIDRDRYKKLKNESEYLEFIEFESEKYPVYIGLFDTEGNLIVESKLEKWVNPKQLLLTDKKLWALSNSSTEKEEDFFKLFHINLNLK